MLLSLGFRVCRPGHRRLQSTGAATLLQQRGADGGQFGAGHIEFLADEVHHAAVLLVHPGQCVLDVTRVGSHQGSELEWQLRALEDSQLDLWRVFNGLCRVSAVRDRRQHGDPAAEVRCGARAPSFQKGDRPISTHAL